MIRATGIHFINKETNYVLLAYQQFKVIGLKGYGGKIEPGETPEESAVNEVTEESGGIVEERLDPTEEGGIQFLSTDLKRVGLIDFYNGTEAEVPFGDPSFRVLFYNCYEYSGNAIDTKQMQRPDWYDIDALPVEELVKGDELFLYDLLHEKPLKGWMRRSADLKTIIDYHFEPCTEAELVI